MRDLHLERTLALAAAVLVCLSGCVQERIIFHPEVLPAHYRYHFGGVWEEVSIPVEGAVLNALLFRVPRPKGVVLYFHGNAGSLRTWGEVAGTFTGRGWDCLIYDYRGFGKSTGGFRCEDDLLDDGKAVYAYVRKRYGEAKIVFYGRSIGTGIAAGVAGAASPHLLILESPYHSLLDLAGHHYPWLPAFVLEAYLRYPLPTYRWLREITCPVAVIHGTRDGIIPFENALRLKGLYPEKVRFFPVPGGGHNDLEDFQQYHRALDAVLS
ncbi:MAG TPA: alpha/beta fold hydrolase [Syntrophales bacterium]|nr:alpha/beta fold hydrolase [Syntrophales bacterium]HOM06711.1 alpha/beta fold hydrolase [Syntrophales bacterium]HPQ06131.1 alpha/beta fold hydrolase [Syntrophales bacterium]